MSTMQRDSRVHGAFSSHHHHLGVSSQTCTHAPLHTEEIQIENQSILLGREQLTSPSDSTSFLLFTIYCAFTKRQERM